MRWVPFQPGEASTRLPWVLLGWTGLLLLLIWDPVTTPGPSLCGMRFLFALPCPLCGMTRGASRVLRGDLSEATQFNPMTLPAFLLLAGLLILWTVECVCSRRLDMAVPDWLRWLGWSLLWLALISTWIFMVTYRREDPFGSSVLGWLLGA